MPSVAFSPDGRLAVSHDLHLWFVRIDGMKVKLPIEPPEVIFSPDGRFIAAIHALRMINIYDSKGHLVWQINLTKAMSNWWQNCLVLAFSLTISSFPPMGITLLPFGINSHGSRVVVWEWKGKK